MALYFDIYSPLSKWKKGDYPLSPTVSIQLVTYFQDQDRRILIGSELMSEQDIDQKIDMFIKELNKVRQSAKKELKKILKKQIPQ